MNDANSQSPAPKPVGIEAGRLSFSYGPKRVFDNVQFVIPAGEVWGLIGRSGIGKTTLLNVILGLFAPDAGSVVTAFGQVNGPGRIRGVVFQEESLLWWLTIIENALFPNHWNRDDASLHRAKTLLDAAGLGGCADLHPKELSAGMRRRVELVRALLIDQEYFVADEPFSAVDVQTKLALYSVWRDLRKANPRTGIISTHDPLEAAVTCDAVIALKGVMDSAAVEIFRVPERFRKEEPLQTAFSDPFVSKLVEIIL